MNNARPSWGTTLILALLAGSLLPGPSQAVLLNEIQVANGTTVLDENGESPDWIELFNPGPALVSLDGWGLSDTTNALLKWTFTNATIAPGEFMLVFASGKDRQPSGLPAVNPATLHGLRVWLRADAINSGDPTQVRASGPDFFVKSWRDQAVGVYHATQSTETNQPLFLPGVPELGGRPVVRFDGVTDLLYLPSSPAQNSFCLVAVARPTAGHEIDPAGPGGVGGVGGQRYLFGAQYGGDLNAGAGLSVGTNGVSTYEHGANYMPAVAVLAASLPTLSIISVNYSNRQPTLTAQGTLTTTGAASPRTTVTAPVEIGAGAYGAFAGDVAELLVFNRALTPAELRGVEEFLRAKYGLRFPRNRHTNFTLDKDGEKIFLTRPDGILADWTPAVEIPRDASWGRQPDGTTNLFFFAAPTPGTNNLTPGATAFLKPVAFSVPAGFYSNNLALELLVTNHPPGTVIRYTTNGAEPTVTSPLYTDSIPLGPRTGVANDLSQIPTAGGWQPPLGEVFKIHVLRARAFHSNALPSEVATASYCVHPLGRARYSLPVVSLTSDRAHFFDPNVGIYVCGNTPGCNFAQAGDPWERPCHVELFETNGTRVLAQESGVRIHGNTSFGFPIKALRLHPLNQKGDGPFRHRIFPDLNVERFYRLLLRPSGHDHYLTMMRDGLMQNLMRETGIDMQGYRPAILFLNGEFWGLHNLQEAFDENYFAEHYPQVDRDAVDYIEGYTPSAAPQAGEATHFNHLIAFMTTNSLATPAHYAHVQTQMEIDNFIDYKCSETLYYRWDIGNHRLWRPRTETGRWRWILFDQDVGYGGFWSQPPSAPWTFPMLAYNLEPNGPWTQFRPQGNDHNSPPVTFQLRALLTNPDFKRQFINRFADLLNGTLSVARMTNLIERMAAEVAPVMAEHCARWRAPADLPTWRANVAWLHRFATNRVPVQRQHITNQFGLRGTVDVTLTVSDPMAGFIRWSTLTLAPPTNAPWTGVYFHDNPVTFHAQAYGGYRFKQWQGLPGPTATNITNSLTLTAPLTLTALFETLPPTNAPIPAPHLLASGPYTFTRWNPDAPAGTYPPHMIFWQTHTNAAPDPTLAAEFTNHWTLPYDRTNRSRITGLGEEGLSFLNTSDPQFDGGGFLGAAVLGLNTTGRTNIHVLWRGGTLSTNTRPYAIRLQYRIGTSNTFTDILKPNLQPVEYIRGAVPGQSQQIGPFTLPAALENQPYAQLRWKYYWLGTGSGARDQLRLDDIVVADPSISPTQPSITLTPNDALTLLFTASPSLTYSLQTSTNLVHWIPTTTSTAAPNGILRFDLLKVTHDPARFFRAVWP